MNSNNESNTPPEGSFKAMLVGPSIAECRKARKQAHRLLDTVLDKGVVSAPVLGKCENGHHYWQEYNVPSPCVHCAVTQIAVLSREVTTTRRGWHDAKAKHYEVVRELSQLSRELRSPRITAGADHNITEPELHTNNNQGVTTTSV